MRCPVCGHEYEQNRRICPTCGSKFKVVQATIAEPRKSQKRIPVAKLLTAAGLCLCALAACFLLPRLWQQSAVTSSTPQMQLPASGTVGTHIPYRHHITFSIQNGRLTLYRDRQQIDSNLITDDYTYQRSLDGAAAAIRASDGTLTYLLPDTIPHTMGSLGLSPLYALSNDGQGLVYLMLLTSLDESATINPSPETDPDILDNPIIFYAPRYALCLINADTDGSVQTLVSNLYAAQIESLVISPDGRTVAYVLSRNGERMLMVTRTGTPQGVQTTTIPFADGYSLIAISNDGEYIYAEVSTQDGITLMCYDLSGVRTPLLTRNPLLSYVSPYYFNVDHTQVLFSSDGTYLSVEGEPALEISDIALHPVVPSNAEIRTGDQHMVYPFESFYNHAYTGVDGLRNTCAWYLTKDSCEKLMPSNLSAWSLDPSGSYLYYISLRTLFCQDITRGYGSQIIIAEDVDYGQLEIDSTGEKVYFMKNETLLCYDRTIGGEPKVIYSPSDHGDEDDIYIGFGNPGTGIWQGKELFRVDDKDRVCFLDDQNLMLYDPKTEKVTICRSQVQHISGSPNGMVFVEIRQDGSTLQYLLEWMDTHMTYIPI